MITSRQANDKKQGCVKCRSHVLLPSGPNTGSNPGGGGILNKKIISCIFIKKIKDTEMY